jgi:heptosyltransferase III
MRAGAVRLLLIQLRYMGDVLLCTPAVRAAREAFPEARLEFLTDALGADALAGNPHLDEVIPWRRGGRAELGLWRELRRRRYDASVDFHSVPRTARLTLAAGAPRRLGVRGRGPRNLAYTHLVPKEGPELYVAAQKLGVLAPLGVERGGRDLSLEIAIGPGERERAARLWSEQGLEGERVVALSAVALQRFKQWGAERWARVGDGLAEAGARVLLTGGPGEEAQVRAVADAMRRPAVHGYGRTTLRELAALYARCALWVGNDGGPKHVAVAAGTPTLTVIRAGLGRGWTDVKRGHRYVEGPLTPACAHGHGECAAAGCLAAVSPEAVVDRALAMLASA